ncbi:MAG: outer membrane beta-barrel protein [Nitrospirae bacterium]|nr:outer membrane beta-barrel protein [Nitrospirota bacterium]MBF0591145.1 outer membrane beta-barrel protein [Nitrospirota bacterium]
MMKKTFLLVMALMLVMLSVVCTSQYAGAADEGRTPFYVGAGTGISWRGPADDNSAKTSFDTGVELTGAFGVRLEGLENKILQNLRIELEYARQFDGNKSVEIHAMKNKIEDASGRIDFETYTAVIYYDLPFRKLAPSTTGFASHLSPYVGLGFGFGRSILKDLSSTSLDYWANMPTSQGGLSKNGAGYHLNTSTDFVYVISPRFGVTYEISKHLDVYMGAKYSKANKVLVDAYGSSSPNGAWNRCNVNIWDAQVGLRYNF